MNLHQSQNIQECFLDLHSARLSRLDWYVLFTDAFPGVATAALALAPFSQPLPEAGVQRSTPVNPSKPAPFTPKDANPALQQARRFATETGPSVAQQAAKPAATAAAAASKAADTLKAAAPPPPSGGGNGLLYALGAAAVGGGGYYYYSSKGGAAPTQPTKPAFVGGDQGFLSLKLAEVIDVNHNTKRFRFELPEKDMVPGLPIASAVLTKYKGENDAKATLRPYTPINDESTYPVIGICAILLTIRLQTSPATLSSSSSSTPAAP